MAGSRQLICINVTINPLICTGISRSQLLMRSERLTITAIGEQNYFALALKMAELVLLKFFKNIYPIPNTENSFTLTSRLAKLQDPAFSCL